MNYCRNLAGLVESTESQKEGRDIILLVMKVDQQGLCVSHMSEVRADGFEDKGESDVDLINVCRPRWRCRGPAVHQWSYSRFLGCNAKNIVWVAVKLALIYF